MTLNEHKALIENRIGILRRAENAISHDLATRHHTPFFEQAIKSQQFARSTKERDDAWASVKRDFEERFKNYTRISVLQAAVDLELDSKHDTSPKADHKWRDHVADERVFRKVLDGIEHYDPILNADFEAAKDLLKVINANLNSSKARLEAVLNDSSDHTPAGAEKRIKALKLLEDYFTPNKAYPVYKERLKTQKLLSKLQDIDAVSFDANGNEKDRTKPLLIRTEGLITSLTRSIYSLAHTALEIESTIDNTLFSARGKNIKKGNQSISNLDVAKTNREMAQAMVYKRLGIDKEELQKVKSAFVVGEPAMRSVCHYNNTFSRQHSTQAEDALIEFNYFMDQKEKFRKYEQNDLNMLLKLGMSEKKLRAKHTEMMAASYAMLDNSVNYLNHLIKDPWYDGFTAHINNSVQRIQRALNPEAINTLATYTKNRQGSDRSPF